MPVVIGIAVAGALGALARYGLDELIGRRAGAFPWGIFVVNVTGACRWDGSWASGTVVAAAGSVGTHCQAPAGLFVRSHS